jgi:hypothetical protein
MPGKIVAVAEVWLDNAYDNITLAQACLAVRSRREKRRIETLGEDPEPPDGEASAERARRLWMPRAFLQTTFASRMAQETCNDSTETAWTYHEHRRLLDDEMMAVCRIYAEVELADLPVHEGERAQKWLMITHKNIERAREHIGMRIRDAGEWGAPPSLPEGRYSYRQRDRRWAVRATLQAEAAATRARLQAVRTGGMPGKPQLAAKADAEPRVKARGPTLLRDPECKVCTGGTSGTSIVSRDIAQGAEEEGDGEAGSEATVQGAGESSESNDDEGVRDSDQC